MHTDWPPNQNDAVLGVDGGMTENDWGMQFLSDILQAPVDRPNILETTALGAAWLAGMKAGIYPDQDGFSKTWALEKRFAYNMEASHADERYERWKRAVTATLSL